MEYPFRNYLYTTEDKIRIFKNIIAYNLHTVIDDDRPKCPSIKIPDEMFLYKNNYVYLFGPTKSSQLVGKNKTDNQEYENVHILSDLFNDTCRSLCAFGNSLSPYEYFMKNKEKLMSDAKNKDPKVLREAMWDAVQECSNHSPTIIKYFIKRYKAKKVLDMSSGWGDRLIGALSSGVDLYMGVDPNPCLHPNYADMIRTLINYSPNPAGEYRLLENRFEDVDMKEYTEYFDLMYSSPPYFDYEKYTDKPGQSYKSFKSQDAWITGFLQPSILKCIRSLKYGGHLVLYFSQERGKTYMEQFLQWILYVNEIWYIGCMHFSLNSNTQKTHPIFIFKKSKTIPKTLLNSKLKIKSTQKNDNLIYSIQNNSFNHSIKQCIKWLLSNKSDVISISFDKNTLLVAYALCLLKWNTLKLYCYATKNDHNAQMKIKFYHANTKFII